MYKDKELEKEATKSRVRRYREKAKGVTFVPKGKENTGEMQGVTYLVNENGGKFRLDMVVDSSWRELLGYLCSHMNPEHMGSLRVGVGGWTIKEVKGLLEVTSGKAT